MKEYLLELQYKKEKRNISENLDIQNVSQCHLIRMPSMKSTKSFDSDAVIM